MEQRKNNSRGQLYLAGALLAAILIGLDQATKWFAVAKLKGNDAFVIINGVFELHYL